MKNDIEVDKIQEAINESSNNVENNTYKILADTNWNDIMENSYYTDPLEKKQREIDIIATNNHFLDFEKKENHRIFFLIECKYIKDKIIFWFKDKKINKAKTLLHRSYVFERLAGSDIQPMMPSTSGPKIHHYLAENKIVKKWDYAKGDNNKSKECQDIVGKSINQLTKALYFHTRMSQRTKNKSSIFPILVINDYKNIYKVGENGDYSNIKKHFQIEVEYSMKVGDHAVEDFYQLIDVVSVKELEEFINYFSNTTLGIILNRLHTDYNNTINRNQVHKKENPAR